MKKITTLLLLIFNTLSPSYAQETSLERITPPQVIRKINAYARQIEKETGIWFSFWEYEKLAVLKKTLRKAKHVLRLSRKGVFPKNTYFNRIEVSQYLTKKTDDHGTVVISLSQTYQETKKYLNSQAEEDLDKKRQVSTLVESINRICETIFDHSGVEIYFWAFEEQKVLKNIFKLVKNIRSLYAEGKIIPQGNRDFKMIWIGPRNKDTNSKNVVKIKYTASKEEVRSHLNSQSNHSSF